MGYAVSSGPVAEGGLSPTALAKLLPGATRKVGRVLLGSHPGFLREQHWHKYKYGRTTPYLAVTFLLPVRMVSFDHAWRGSFQRVSASWLATSTVRMERYRASSASSRPRLRPIPT